MTPSMIPCAFSRWKSELIEDSHDLPAERDERAPQGQYRDQSRKDERDLVGIVHLRHVAQPVLLVAEALRGHTDDESGGAQEVVKILDDHRPHESAQLPGDPHRVAENRHHAHDDQRGEAEDGVDRAEVVRFRDVHQADADQAEDQAEHLQDPVQVLAGAAWQSTGQDVAGRQHQDGLRHQQDILEDEIDWWMIVERSSLSDKLLEVL